MDSPINPSMFHDTALKEAAQLIDRHDFDALQKRIQAGLKINSHDADGPTLLMYALGKQNKKAGQALLDFGADPNIYAANRMSAMMLAAGGSDIAWLQMFLAKGGNPNLTNNHYEPITFSAASHRGEMQNLLYLLDHGADINATDRAGNTLLHVLAEIDNYEPVYKLLERGADFRLADSTGWTLAHFIQDSRLKPTSDEGQWMMKCRQFLLSKGVAFPPPPPHIKGK